MRIIPLYRYTRPDGGVTVSPIKPDAEYTELCRLIADEGMAITNGVIITDCIDVNSADGWIDCEPEITEGN